MARRALILGLGLMSVLLPAAAAPKKPAPAAKATPAAAKPDPAAAIARLKKDEARLRCGRLSLHGMARQGALTEDASLPAAWTTAKQLPLTGQTREYYLFSGEGWKRDITVMDAQGNPENHLVVGVRKDDTRIFQETGHGEQTKRLGTLGLEPQQNVVDRLLQGRGADLLEGATWKSALRQGAQLVLSGTRGDERLTVHLRTAPAYAVERLISEETTLTPEGRVHRGQEVQVTYAPEQGGLLAPKTVQHLVFIGAPRNEVQLTTYKVEGAQLNPTLAADELSVPFPQGTTVTDRRLDTPVRYVQGEHDLSPAELKALQEKQAGSYAQVGKLSPEWSGKSLDGKSIKVQDYRGRVLLLTFFASWCAPCHAEAPQMEANIWQKYRDKGLTVIGINTGEESDPDKRAQEFVAEHHLTYPVLVDGDDQLSQIFQIKIMPSIAILDRKGTVRYLKPGFDPAVITQQIEELLAEQ